MIEESNLLYQNSKNLIARNELQVQLFIFHLPQEKDYVHWRIDNGKDQGMAAENKPKMIREDHHQLKLIYISY